MSNRRCAPTPGLDLDVTVTQDDIDAAVALGATGTQLIERSIHSALDRRGIPRDGRVVTVGLSHITIDLPADSPPL